MRTPRVLGATALILLAAAPTASAAFDLEAHRGGRGLRPENTLASFGNALRLGVTTLELDTGVTKDGVVVVSHERRFSTLECSGPHIGKLIKDLTLKQVKQMDCGTRHPDVPSTDPFVGTQESVPGTKMPTLAEVFQLANRYEANGVQFNIETKLDPTLPKETVAPATFARKVIDVIKRYKMTKRSLLQSFDWRTLVAARKLSPSLRRVALAQKATIFKGTPWTAGIAIGAKPFDDGSLALAVKDDLKANVLSPNFPDLTDKLIKSAHNRGLTVIPWTVNEKADMTSLINRGVDGIISDYPDRLRDVMDAKNLALPDPIASPFDVEAHRGGRRYRPENTLPAFSYGLSRNVDTLELDTGVTADGVLVVAHDRSINPNHCTGDANILGKPIHELTLAQIKTLDCGSKGDFAGQPGWVASPGAKMPTLQEVFDLVAASGDDDVRFNIETKISPTVDDTAPYDVFTAKLVKAIQDNNLQDRAMIQSFDWRTIRLAKQLDPRIDTVALVWQYAGADCDDIADECSLEAVVGDPSVTSPWTGGLDWWKYKDLGRLVRAAQADVVSSNWQVHDPTQGKVNSADSYLVEDPAIYHGPPVPTLQARGVKVVPYTVNDQPTIQRVIDLGVDGIISDDPDTLLLVAKRNGLR
ncbi:glycerophosphodiester phosphodiesterase family protein [Solirubrobacter ginsenosidimutans]|uniref:Glycerophosphodiester phosphodiesterase family protein n=1 Tax=Solirubrobacter ginsenosidimutans TaxID=490573 RepID=A0A9X3MUC5_9ACTN|nr:glycerophosphodiester phosphodiesterase family protein [Solirubrobacter ginsenosidimutans]MDA0161405.1 glycerophosphodiester phosphodiesterase family protein [Solirubrobacter ginsenosidimutans]